MNKRNTEWMNECCWEPHIHVDAHVKFVFIVPSFRDVYMDMKERRVTSSLLEGAFTVAISLFTIYLFIIYVLLKTPNRWQLFGNGGK